VSGVTDTRGRELLRLVEVMDQLRSPGGCPWDAEQTHASLLEYLLEEAYETVEAVESDDRAALREELGDVLLQVVFHARIAQEHGSDPFDIDDVASGIADKLIRRHPHVFADDDLDDGEDLHVRWDKMKAAEKARTSVTDGVPATMPASLLAMKLLGRASRNDVTASVPAADPVLADSVRNAVMQRGSSAGDDAGEVYGELMLAVIASAAEQGVDVEAALRQAVRAYRQRIIEAEQTNLAAGH
jgi:XTP/dITP diphosphohydrolase